MKARSYLNRSRHRIERNEPKRWFPLEFVSDSHCNTIRVSSAQTCIHVRHPKCTSWNLSPKFTEPDTSVTRASMCLNSFWNAGHRVSTTPVLRAARIVRVLYVCGAGVYARASFLFCSLLRSSLVPSSPFEDKRERSAPRFENALHRDFIFFFSPSPPPPSWLKAAPRASPARELQSRILLLVYALKQFTVAAHLRRNCGAWHRWRTF